MTSVASSRPSKAAAHACSSEASAMISSAKASAVRRRGPKPASSASSASVVARQLGRGRRRADRLALQQDARAAVQAGVAAGQQLLQRGVGEHAVVDVGHPDQRERDRQAEEVAVGEAQRAAADLGAGGVGRQRRQLVQQRLVAGRIRDGAHEARVAVGAAGRRDGRLALAGQLQAGGADPDQADRAEVHQRVGADVLVGLDQRDVGRQAVAQRRHLGQLRVVGAGRALAARVGVHADDEVELRMGGGVGDRAVDPVALGGERAAPVLVAGDLVI